MGRNAIGARAARAGCLALPAVLLAAGCGDDASPDGQPPVMAPPVSTSPGTAGPVPSVDVFVGTGYSAALGPLGKSGSTFPGAAAPFGLVQWSPDTPGAHPAGYLHEDGEIYSFSLTHLDGAGCAALRDFPIFPIVEELDPRFEPSATFSHDAEIASPGFYEVTFDNGIQVDLTASQRSGLARFTFPASPRAKVLLASGFLRDLLHIEGFEARVVGADTLTATRAVPRRSTRDQGALLRQRATDCVSTIRKSGSRIPDSTRRTRRD